MNKEPPEAGYRVLTLNITDELADRRVLSLLLHRLHLPQSKISALKTRQNGICLNGVQCHTDEVVKAGDILTAEISDPPADNGFIPCAYPLDIVYEDEDLLILNKAAGMTAHAIQGEPGYTVPNALSAVLGTDCPIHIVNRLDRGTSGLMAVARNGFAHDRLREALHTERFQREYLAICSGIFPQNQMKVQLPVEGRTAETILTLTEQKEEFALVRARLKTGRRHQIRIHCASLGCPLAGDLTYEGPEAGLSHPALHSAYLRLTHPVTGKTLEFEAPLPPDLQQFWKSCGPQEKPELQNSESACAKQE